MRLFSLSPISLLTGFLCAQAAAQRASVRDASALGLTVQRQGDNGLVVSGPGFFLANLYVDQLFDQIHVESIDNPERIIKSREALLSVWQHQTGKSASKLKRIKYTSVDNPYSVNVLHSIWEDHEKNKPDEEEEEDDDDYGNSYMYDSDSEEDEKDDVIQPAMTVERPPAGEQNWQYSDLLNKTPFGVGAAKMCSEYTEMENHFVKSFTFGHDVRVGRWLAVNFGVQK